MVSKTLFSSETTEWCTPQALFDELNREFMFDLDVAASVKNAKCKRFFTLSRSAFNQFWRYRVWCNPPYGNAIGKWLEHGRFNIDKGYCEIAVYLLPARTDTKWYHEHIYDKEKKAFREGVEVRFLPGRLTFVGAQWPAPFPSMVVIFSPK